MNIEEKIENYLSEGHLPVGTKVKIKAKVSGLKPKHEGIITNRDGEYYLVLPKGRKKGQEVELYLSEIEPM